MGYYTDFSLDSYHEDVIIPEGVTGYCDQDFFDSKEAHDAKWYHHIEDMLKVSLANPDVEFRTSGVGEEPEEPEDQWQCVFLNGKYKKVVAEITFKDFKDVEWK